MADCTHAEQRDLARRLKRMVADMSEWVVRRECEDAG